LTLKTEKLKTFTKLKTGLEQHEPSLLIHLHFALLECKEVYQMDGIFATDGTVSSIRLGLVMQSRCPDNVLMSTWIWTCWLSSFFQCVCVWQVLLVSSSRHPDQWIVPGGGMEPEEEPGGAAVREVYEEVSHVLEVSSSTRALKV